MEVIPIDISTNALSNRVSLNSFDVCQARDSLAMHLKSFSAFEFQKAHKIIHFFFFFT